MLNAQTIRDLLAKGISRFEKPYGTASTRIQLVMYIDAHETVQYITCIDTEPKNTVQLKDLIGRNIYNPMVAGHIKKLITTMAQKHGSAPREINLMVDIDNENQVVVYVRKDKQIISKVADGELTGQPTTIR